MVTSLPPTAGHGPNNVACARRFRHALALLLALLPCATASLGPGEVGSWETHERVAALRVAAVKRRRRAAATTAPQAVNAAAVPTIGGGAAAAACGVRLFAPEVACCILYVRHPTTVLGKSWGTFSRAQQHFWQWHRCDSYRAFVAAGREKYAALGLGGAEARNDDAAPSLPVASTRWSFARDGAGSPQPTWVYLVGDSSLRIFNAAFVARLNGTLLDPRFGSWTSGAKGGCEGKYDNECSKEGRHKFTFACLREFVDWGSRTRVTYTFKTVAEQHMDVLDHLVTPSNEPDVFVLATGPHNFYRGASEDTAAEAALVWLREMVLRYPRSKVVFLNAVACEHRHALRFNALVASFVRNTPVLASRVVLIDREANTKGQLGAGRCVGWHAFGATVQRHVAQFMQLMPGRWNSTWHAS